MLNQSKLEKLDYKKMTTQKSVSDKQRIVALLLCWFLGIFGAHRFYVGKTGTGLLMLVLTLSFFGMIVSGVWYFVDLIIIASGSFEDKDGAVVKSWSN